MIKITYIDGSVQNINVDGSFFAITLAEKNGRKIKLTPMDKAEDIAVDLSYVRRRGLNKVELFENPDDAGKIKVFAPLRESDKQYYPKSLNYITEVNLLRKKFKNVPFKGSEKLVF
jgi:hypothetical protein